MGDAMALDACTRVFAHIENATRSGDKDARYHMMFAALQAMMASKGLGPVHALANTFGDQGLHHGAIVTIAMPAVLRAYETRYAEKTKKLADAIGLTSGTPAEAIAAMNERLGIPATMRKLGYKGGDVAELATDSHKSFFNFTAPFHPSVDEYRGLVEEVLG
jgi:alcohol dehydrogenase class IV